MFSFGPLPYMVNRLSIKLMLAERWMKPAWDAIVIGSGIGGLTAAGLLARVAKMRVLVLEKHTERGGLTHTFRRDGASWDVGLHYVGNVQEGSFERRIFDFLSGAALRWNQMPDDFERFIYPGVDFPLSQVLTYGLMAGTYGRHSHRARCL